MKADLKSSKHLKFILPLASVAVVGLAVFQLGLVDRLTGGDETASAAEPVVSEPAATEPAATEPEPDGEAAQGTTKPTGMDQIEAALKKNPWLVVLVYRPDGEVDELATADARAGAQAAKAGFLALDSSKERMIRDVANAFQVRTTPTLLIVTGGPNLANKVEGYADEQTVAQLVEDARREAAAAG